MRVTSIAATAVMVDSNSSPMLRSHCCFIVWLEASWRSCLSHECGAVGAVDVAVHGCEDGAECAFLEDTGVGCRRLPCCVSQRVVTALPT